MGFFDNYKMLCESKGKTANAVAKELGIPSSSVTQWKHGTTPRPDTLKKIAEYFRITINELMYGKSEKTEPEKKHSAAVRDGVYKEVIDGIGSLSPQQVQDVADYIAFLKSRGAK